MNSNKCYSFRPHEKLTFEVNEHTKYIDSSDLAISYIKGAVSLRKVRNWHQSSSPNVRCNSGRRCQQRGVAKCLSSLSLSLSLAKSSGKLLLRQALRVIYSDAALMPGIPRAPSLRPRALPGSRWWLRTHTRTHTSRPPTPNTNPHTMYKRMYEHAHAVCLPPRAWTQFLCRK